MHPHRVTIVRFPAPSRRWWRAEGASPGPAVTPLPPSGSGSAWVSRTRICTRSPPTTWWPPSKTLKRPGSPSMPFGNRGSPTTSSRSRAATLARRRPRATPSRSRRPALLLPQRLLQPILGDDVHGRLLGGEAGVVLRRLRLERHLLGGHVELVDVRVRRHQPRRHRIGLIAGARASLPDLRRLPRRP